MPTTTPTLYSQADLAAMLAEASGDNYDTVYTRVRSWHKRGKLPSPAAHRANGWPLWSQEVADQLLADKAPPGA